MRRLLSALAVTSCLIAGFPAISSAQNGFTLWSGVEGKNQLNYRYDFGGQADGSDRLRLRLDGKKLKTAVAHFVIAYPKYYKGSFDSKKMEVRVKGKKVPLQEAKWDKDNNVIEIYPQEPIAAGSGVEIVLSNIRNPAYGGMYYFNCSTQSPGDVPLSRYIGTWIISVQ